MAGLRAESARKLADAEEAYAKAKGVLEDAERERTKWRARCRPLLEDRELHVIGGVEIRVTPTSTGQSFRLSEYLSQHPLTDAMRSFVTKASTYDRWTVKRRDTA